MENNTINIQDRHLDFETCLTLLNQKSTTHPCLSKLWIDYFSSMNNKPTYNELQNCLTAIEHMNTIPDLNDKQIQIIYGIGTMKTITNNTL